MFPWGVKDAIRGGVRSGCNGCIQVSFRQGIGIVQFLNSCRISCSSTPTSIMDLNCCSRRASLIVWSVSICSHTAISSCESNTSPPLVRLFSKIIFSVIACCWSCCCRMSFALFWSNVAVRTRYSLVEIGILIGLSLLSVVVRTAKSAAKLASWLVSSTRVSQGDFWSLVGVLRRMFLRPVFSDTLVS